MSLAIYLTHYLSYQSGFKKGYMYGHSNGYKKGKNERFHRNDEYDMNLDYELENYDFTIYWINSFSKEINVT